MRSKEIELVESKADAGGEFAALASVFGNVDAQGDRVMPGAFTETLRDWRSSGRELPIIFSHKSDELSAYIGSADPNEVRETGRGLEVRGRLDVATNPTAKQVALLLKRGNLNGWSFGYRVPAGGESIADDGANELHRIELIEVGPTLRGANQEARTLAIKSLESLPDRYRIGGERAKMSELPVRMAEFSTG